MLDAPQAEVEQAEAEQAPEEQQLALFDAQEVSQRERQKTAQVMKRRTMQLFI